MNIIGHPTASLAQRILYLATPPATPTLCTTPARMLATLISVTVLPIFLTIECTARLLKLSLFSLWALPLTQVRRECAHLGKIFFNLLKLPLGLCYSQHVRDVATQFLLSTAHSESRKEPDVIPIESLKVDIEALKAWATEETASMRESERKERREAGALITACSSAQCSYSIELESAQPDTKHKRPSEAMTILDFSQIHLTTLPDLNSLKYLTTLSLPGQHLKEASCEKFNQLTRLKKLEYKHFAQSAFPTAIFNLKNLEVLDFTDAPHLTEIPTNEILIQLPKLRELILRDCQCLSRETHQAIKHVTAMTDSEQKNHGRINRLTIRAD